MGLVGPYKDPDPPLPEPEPKEDVGGWRLEQLEHAGYPLDMAQVIAGRRDIDLHRAVELLRDGCPVKTAGRILL